MPLVVPSIASVYLPSNDSELVLLLGRFLDVCHLGRQIMNSEVSAHVLLIPDLYSYSYLMCPERVGLEALGGKRESCLTNSRCRGDPSDVPPPSCRRS